MRTKRVGQLHHGDVAPGVGASRRPPVLQTGALHTELSRDSNSDWARQRPEQHTLALANTSINSADIRSEDSSLNESASADSAQFPSGHDAAGNVFSGITSHNLTRVVPCVGYDPTT